MAEDKDPSQQARITAESILEQAMDVLEDAPPAKEPMIKIDDAVDGVVDATQSGIKRRSRFRRLGVVTIVLFLFLGIAGALLFFQWRWFQAGTQVVVKMLDEKMRETIKKSLDETVNKSAMKETPVDDSASATKYAETGTPKSREEAAPVDTSKFIIEANRIYEQGDYEKAATLYGKGMDKSMSFRNEDFVVYRMGDCRFRTGKYEEALKTFQSLNSEYVKSPFRFKSLLKTGECYAAMGDLKKARKTLYTLIAQEGKCIDDEDKSIVVDAYFKIAGYYMEEGKQLRTKSAGSSVTHTQSLALK